MLTLTDILAIPDGPEKNFRDPQRLLQLLVATGAQDVRGRLGGFRGSLVLRLQRDHGIS
jgi:hypothetical protein